MKDLAACMESGTVIFRRREDEAGAAPWTPHPAFPGVSLKLLVSGKDTAGGLSCHLVRVEPGCELKNHAHDGQWELHEVVRGRGTATLDGRKIGYEPGRVMVIPKGTPHAVRADADQGEGLFLFAKFFPALV